MKIKVITGIGIGLFLLIVLIKVTGVFPFRLYTVITGSMSPTFEAGSLIIVKHGNDGVYQKGDILAYLTDGESVLVTHRIMEVRQDGEGFSYITRGDANNIDDLQPVTQKQAVGRVVFWINGLGEAFLFIRTPKGILLVLSVMMLLILVSYLWDLLFKKQRQCKTIER